MPDRPSLLIIACGALARELGDVLSINELASVTIECLPVGLHHTPKDIPAAVEARLDRAVGYDKILVGYADCGTGGTLDTLLEARGVERLPGAHCYEFFAGSPKFAELHEAELGTFYLTDYLAKHFDLFVYNFLGIDRHPDLRDMYFGNYRKLVFLSQTDNPDILAKAQKAADRLGLSFERHHVGYGEFETSIVQFAEKAN
jgi:hypothetical protein